METNKKKATAILIGIYLLFALTALYIFYQTPYCHDEWHWGLSDRFELMLDGFKNYNGRYLGNLFIILITRSTFWKTLLPALLMVWLLEEMERGTLTPALKKGMGRRVFLLLFCIFLLISLPSTLYAQSYGWLAAFTNFVPPVILFLTWYNWSDNIYGPGPLCNTKWKFPALLLAFATQLFSEHITIFIVVYALWTVFFTKIRKGKFYSLHLYYLAGALLGAVVMFSNGAYTSAMSREEGFKSINLSFSSMFYKLRDEMADHLFLNNWILLVLLAAVLIFLLAKKGRRTALDVGTAVVLYLYAGYSVWHFICPDWAFVSEEGINNSIELLLAALYAAAVLVCIWRTVDQDRRMAIFILYLCSLASAAPLMAANPIGARCFYFCYILQCMAVLKLLAAAMESVKGSFLYPSIAVAAAVAIFGIAYMDMFTEIGSVNQERAQIIKEAAKNNIVEITLPYLPYANVYTWTTTPTDEGWLDIFKEFYGIPEETTVYFQ